MKRKRFIQQWDPVPANRPSEQRQMRNKSYYVLQTAWHAIIPTCQTRNAIGARVTL